MRFAFALILCAACGDGTPPSARDAAPPRDLGGVDQSPSPPRFRGAVTLPFRAQLHWTASGGPALGPLAGAELTDNVGTILYDGQTLPALLYRVIPSPPFDLAAIVATTPDDVIVLYAYCRNGGVASWFYEALDAPTTMQCVWTSGTCQLSPGVPTTAQVSFREWTRLPPNLLHATQATIDGPLLHVARGVGDATFGGVKWDVTAFDWVDCSTCGRGGWYELHSLLRQGTAVSFGIFYLLNNRPGSVDFEYGWRFDIPGEDPPKTRFTATWTVH